MTLIATTIILTCIVGVGIFLRKKTKTLGSGEAARKGRTRAQETVVRQYLVNKFAKCVALNRKRLKRYHRTQHKIVADFGDKGNKATYAAKVDLFYGTDRCQTGAFTIKSFYGGRSSNQLHLGHCEVSIPEGHKAGELERPLLRCFGETPKDHVCLLSLQSLSPEDYLSRIRELFSSNEDEALIFVHGYNNSFHDAALRTAQFVHDLKFGGKPFFYSWPSLGSFCGYVKDMDAAVNARSTFEQFIRLIKENLNPPKVYLIGHSMGNVLIAEYIKSLRKEDNIFTHIVLAAPDINKDVFHNQVMPNFKLATQKSTLYTCRKDFAIYAAERIRGMEPRLGDSRTGIYVAESLYTIDASDLATGLFSTHHTYFAQDSPILDDIIHGVFNDIHPSRRRLVEKQAAQGPYWSFPA